MNLNNLNLSQSVSEATPLSQSEVCNLSVGIIIIMLIVLIYIAYDTEPFCSNPCGSGVVRTVKPCLPGSILGTSSCSGSAVATTSCPTQSSCVAGQWINPLTETGPFTIENVDGLRGNIIHTTGTTGQVLRTRSYGGSPNHLSKWVVKQSPDKTAYNIFRYISGGGSSPMVLGGYLHCDGSSNLYYTSINQSTAYYNQNYQKWRITPVTTDTNTINTFPHLKGTYYITNVGKNTQITQGTDSYLYMQNHATRNICRWYFNKI